MHEADLVGVHEARIAHHVAAVGQVDRQHRAAAVRDRATSRACAASRRCARGCRGRGKPLPGASRKPVSIAITSSKWPWIGQSFTIRILPSRSMICALISPDFLVHQHFVAAVCRRESAGGFPARTWGRANRCRAASPAAAWSSPTTSAAACPTTWAWATDWA